MNRILKSDWCSEKRTLLTVLVGSFSLDIDLVLLFGVSVDLGFVLFKKGTCTDGQYPAILTSELVDNTYVYP